MADAERQNLRGRTRQPQTEEAIRYLRTYLDDDEYPEDTTDRLIQAVTDEAQNGDSDIFKMKITALYLFAVEGVT